jgi:general stress protein CsbA
LLRVVLFAHITIVRLVTIVLDLQGGLLLHSRIPVAGILPLIDG